MVINRALDDDSGWQRGQRAELIRCKSHVLAQIDTWSRHVQWQYVACHSGSGLNAYRDEWAKALPFTTATSVRFAAQHFRVLLLLLDAVQYSFPGLSQSELTKGIYSRVLEASHPLTIVLIHFFILARFVSCNDVMTSLFKLESHLTFFAGCQGKNRHEPFIKSNLSANADSAFMTQRCKTRRLIFGASVFSDRCRCVTELYFCFHGRNLSLWVNSFKSKTKQTPPIMAWHDSLISNGTRINPFSVFNFVSMKRKLHK